MNLYNMRRRTKYCHVKFACTIVYHTLVVCYHDAHCSIAYLVCCLDISGIVISCDSEVKKCKTGHERGWYIGGKEKWGDKKMEKRRGERGKYLP